MTPDQALMKKAMAAALAAVRHAVALEEAQAQYAEAIEALAEVVDYPPPRRPHAAS